MANYEPARDAYVVVASSAKEQWVRWVACLNLIDIESQAGNREAFDRYVLLLRSEKLTAELRMLYQLNIGEGLLRFGELLLAREHLKRALAMASEYGLNETVIEAERLLASTDDPQPSLRQEPLQNELIRIATVLRGMRAAVSG